jgi:hypothetical protein
MESPAYWKTAELIISDALEDHEKAMTAGMVGASTMHLIADRLREAGLLNDDHEPYIGWDKLREHHAKRDGKPVPERGPRPEPPEHRRCHGQ